MTERSHFLCEFQLYGQRKLVIWYSNEKDGLLLNSRGNLALFDSPAQAESHARSLSIALEPQQTEQYDFDSLLAWCHKPNGSSFDYTRFLNAWNMLSDLSSSHGGWPKFQAIDSRLNTIYDKLFHGNNLPSITPNGEHYEPSWSSKELHDLAKLFLTGIQELHAIWAA